MGINKLASYLALHDRLEKWPQCKPQGVEESGPEARLDYPTREMTGPSGEKLEAYLIPEEDKEKVLREMYPFLETPSLDDEMFDLHENRNFRVGDYLVIRDSEQNFLVSPYFGHTGGSVLDWVPPERFSECKKGEGDSCFTCIVAAKCK